MITHSAYNLTTGEILECSNGNYLKKMVAITTYCDKYYHNCSTNSEWIFAHGKNSTEKVCKKAQKILEKRKNPLTSI